MKINDEIFLAFLYESTFEILKNQGAKGWTMDDICENVAISKDTLYRAVSSKADLILKSLNFELSLHIKNMEEIINSGIDYYTAFTNLIEILCKTLEKFSSKQLQSVLQNYPLSSRYAKKEFEKIVTLIELFLQKGIDNNCLRNNLNITFLSKNIHNNILYIIEKENPKDYEACINNYFDILFNGINKSQK
ncbi:MAG: TetR/AcrR family transcriptional regulator [Eubacteriales bacterium]